MTRDIPGDGFYFSAIKIFIKWTAYANVKGDRWWAGEYNYG